MAIDTSGQWWTGSDAQDIDAYLAALTGDDDGTPRVLHSQCGDCGNEHFRLRVDAEEGCAERTCASCGSSALMLDSEDTVDDAALEHVRCACGRDTFDVAVGFSQRDNGDVRWVYLGIRCVADGVLGSCADWSIDYSPSEHLYATA